MTTSIFDLIKYRPGMPDGIEKFIHTCYTNQSHECHGCKQRGFNTANTAWLEALKQIEAPKVERVSVEEIKNLILEKMAKDKVQFDTPACVKHGWYHEDLAAAIHAEVYEEE